MRTSLHKTPSEMGLTFADVDLTAIATTKYSTGLIDCRQFFIFTAIINVLETGAPGAGDFKLTVNVLAKDKVTTLWTIDLLTLIDSQTDGTQEVVVFGAGVLAAKTTASTGTLSPDVEVLKVIPYMEMVLEVTTANTGTTSTAEMHILLEG